MFLLGGIDGLIHQRSIEANAYACFIEGSIDLKDICCCNIGHGLQK
jgi:hypothetical protein